MEKVLRMAVQENPTHKRAVNNLAIVIGHQGHFDESLAMFRRVVGEAEANANLAYIHVQRGEGQAATQRYSRALTLDSNLEAATRAMLQIAEMQQRLARTERHSARLAVAGNKAPGPATAAEPQQGWPQDASGDGVVRVTHVGSQAQPADGEHQNNIGHPGTGAAIGGPLP